VDGGGAAALRKALIHLAAQEKQRLQRGTPPVRTEWVFRRSAAAAATTPLSGGGGGGGGLPAALRTDSQVSFSSTLTNVRTFDLSPTEETAKQRHWQAVKLGSEQQQGSGSPAPQRPWSAAAPTPQRPWSAAAAAADTVATAERTNAHTRVLASAKVAQAAREEAAAAAEEAAVMRAKCGGPPALPVLTAAGTSPPPPRRHLSVTSVRGAGCGVRARRAVRGVCVSGRGRRDG
jgi:hypothetical protein